MIGWGDWLMSARQRRTIWLAIVAGAAFALILWQWQRFVTQSYLRSGAAQAEAALRLTSNGLTGHLARYETVPQLLADLASIRALADDPQNLALRRATDLELEKRNASLAASDIYIMDLTGTTIAASNHARADTFNGQNFSYRPYFYEAAGGAFARFYALGTTSGVRGYYFSAPVRRSDETIGAVIAVKIGLDQLEAAWRGGELRVFVTDPEGVVFMSSEPDWLYGGLLPLNAERQTRMRGWRRYSDATLHQLPLSSSLQSGVLLTKIAGSEFITAEQAMPAAGWTVHVLLDARGARTQAQIAVAVLVLVALVGGFGLVLLQQRRARSNERRALEQAAQRQLEARVVERTADLARVNHQLGLEIAERRAAETELRQAQDSLVQAGKLAALGQMSAALSHEINQPLAAARNYADSAAILIEREDYPRARENIAQILSLIDRMAAIGRHLRNVARNPNERLGPVRLQSILGETKVITEARLAACGAALLIDVPPDFPPIKGGATRLQQVLVNLILNAADAVEGLADRTIRLSAATEGDWALLRVTDKGSGVAAALRNRIFDPFFTTKGVGAGLGLGLSISYNIVHDFGGSISVEDANPGAVFTVRLPLASQEEVAA